MKIEPLFLLCQFFVGITCNAQTIFLPHHLSLHQISQKIAYKKKDHLVECAFDIHKVLVHKVTRDQISLLWRSSYHWHIIKGLFNAALVADLSSILWQLILNVQPWFGNKHREINGERLISAFTNAGEPELAELFTDLLNEQKVDPEVKKIIIELKKAGYTLRIASNIGINIFEKLTAKFAQLHENIFEYFDRDAQNQPGKTIDYTKSFIQKPNADYYIQFLDSYDPERKKIIIFIDDKLVNVKEAVAQGFVGIHFKNALQLRHDLKKLGIKEI